jgi:predicted transcriptional regulator
MTTKQKMLALLESLDDDTSIEQAIDRLYLMQKVEIGLEQAQAGDTMDHDEFMRQLEDEENA